MKITTLPVYSKLADTIPPEIADKLPSGWRLSQHQVETYNALTSSDYDVIFNTAMTGDGKSLAGQLPTLLKYLGTPLLAMYPTNELIRDQARQLANAQNEWQATDLQKAFLDSSELDRLMADNDFSQRGEALLSHLLNYDVLLTNPDIFHYIMESFYVRRGTQGDAPDRIIRQLVNKFQQFTFDEFHIFETPQVMSVVTAILFIQEVTGPRAPRHLFLSATPGLQMLKFLERSGLRYCEINPARQGWYKHSFANPDEDKWRLILRASNIHFSTERIEVWVETHLDDILLSFFVTHRPAAKGAIIVNSIAAAKRLTAFLKPIFAQHNLTVKENTGLTSQAGRAASYEADLLIGTSTVDVGVDFKINFLIFESLNAGTFLQRLGRLGRHAGFTRNGQTHQFEIFEAHALVTEWVQETLFVGRDGAAPLLAENTIITRQTLNEAIEKAYPPPATFERYAQTWGQFQPFHIIYNLNHPTIKTQYSQLRDQLGTRYQDAFAINLKRTYAQRRELQQAQHNLLFDEALSFRGGSYFDCAIVDRTESGPPLPKLYDLFGLAANGVLVPLEEGEFYNWVQQAGLSKRIFERANNSGGPLAYFELQGWRNERNEYQLFLRHDIGTWDSTRFGQALVLKGVELNTNLPGLDALNNRLRRRNLPATLCLAFNHPLELKRRLYLPPLFSVYQFTSRDRLTGCITFGREALLLDTKLKYRPIDCGGGPLIC